MFLGLSSGLISLADMKFKERIKLTKSTINISKMIVHKLNIFDKEPIYNETCIDLTNKEVLDAIPFFEKHINNSRKQGSMKRCQFLGLDNNVIRKSMSTIMDSGKTEHLEKVFIEESKNITKRLADRIKGSSSKSDGSLFVIMYSDGEREFVGILKMDPNDGVQVNDDLSITVRKDMLPSVNEKLHKSALIELKEYKENDFHLFVLDKQQSVSEPARYFMEYFLNAIELHSDINITKFVQSQIAESFTSLIESDDISVLNSQLRNKMSEQSKFSIDTDLEPIIRPLLKEPFRELDISDHINDFKDKILKSYPDAEFEFVPDVKSVKEMIFRTPDKQVELKFSPHLKYNEDYIIEPKNNGDVIITLKNGVGSELEEVPTRRR